MIFEKDILENPLNPLTHPYLRLAQGIINQAVRDGDVRYLKSIQGQVLIDNLELTTQQVESLLETAASSKKQWGREVQWQGKTVTISELSRQTGIRYQVLYDRICVRGWDVDAAVANGNKAPKKKNYIWNGQPTTLAEISRSTGVNFPTLYARIHRYKIPLDQAVAKGLKERRGKDE